MSKIDRYVDADINDVIDINLLAQNIHYFKWISAVCCHAVGLFGQVINISLSNISVVF